MVNPTADTVEAFLSAATTNMCTAQRSPNDADASDAAVAAVMLHAPEALVALPVGDATLDTLGIAAALEAAGCTVLRADDPAWRERLPQVAAGITGAVLAVAEQGVVALACGPGSPRGTSLLPPTHICVVRSQDVVATFAEALDRIASRDLPSALVWVGGPSRTGDLGMTLTLGVHGPRAVTVIVVDGPQATE